MNDFVFLEIAKSEYYTALDWYSKQSLSAAERFAIEIDQAIESIRKHPEQNPSWDDRHRYFLLRKFPYFVGYRFLSGEILIVAVRHSSQDQDAWTGR